MLIMVTISNNISKKFIMPPAAILLNKHMCPMLTSGVPPIPHAGGGMVILGCPNVNIFPQYIIIRMGVP